MTADAKCSYMLRIPGRKPTDMRLDRLAAYMAELASLLGPKNEPTFAAIKDASVGVCASVPVARQKAAFTRVYQAKHDSASRPAVHMRRIEALLSQDGLPRAELRDGCDKIIHLFKAPEPRNLNVFTIKQSGQVDGTVTGLVGADDTMHLYLRDALDRDLKLIVKDESLARDLLAYFRSGVLRVQIDGQWIRTEDGWIPEASKCVVSAFEVLDALPARRVFQEIASLPGNGWSDIEDPVGAWRDLRGLH